MKFHHLPFELCEPKTIKGEEKLIGVFDFDGNMTRFKTLGAKRYIKEFWKDDKLKLEITISGVAKVSGIDYLLHEYKLFQIHKFSFCNLGLIYNNLLMEIL